MKYETKKVHELTATQIEDILELWNVPQWNGITTDEFRTSFSNSEFHFLVEGNKILAVLRLNMDLILDIDDKEHAFMEVVGFVSSEKNKGYGRKLLHYFKDHIQERNLEVIGFCKAELRPFYEKCQIRILYNQARIIKEKEGTAWINSEDDDTLIFTLSDEKATLLSQLPENKTYLKDQ
ncbi:MULTISPECIES: GNAT family N-acetyltransferase [Chryseobacterium]|uniref:Superfamily II DNA or RNA helicase n=1 Tax=Chryseobacterium camelliae TaxID=1265445 RepID=A0ABU0TEV0_9FLAO|nr:MULTISPECIES: GNAT family N-acetyltransferase [Chryseobacterium]MDT3406609.1 superfamily II DNA or RNA helicase [Pseudacidovorax intermedius]MDQ1095595.1 superfamily II DNA or RNA helicase [Chryseobacterium camelliae]MDQ1099531.1 superfamily II DNA or RNA helicase [Chryseobacterium sp. SORGH_AS_1048]MDR6086878.1 superfamily II DNA or RNA helicase [Chryseobacterium sp. SORGH_AS_0909]MDR6131251.1 superfamily II DNA or RNA helicase [Chryseobacterium sp. SORGH_AS_1175]